MKPVLRPKLQYGNTSNSFITANGATRALAMWLLLCSHRISVNNNRLLETGVSTIARTPHMVFIPKRRKKVSYGQVRRLLGESFQELASHKEVAMVAGPLRSDHVHLCWRVPPKYAVSNVVGYLTGKSAILSARFFVGKERNFTGENFWARGYLVSTVGLDEASIIAY